MGIDSEPFVSPSLYTSEEGILSYYEVCEMMANKDSRVYWDDLVWSFKLKIQLTISVYR